MARHRQDSSAAYSTLLRTELLGDAAGSFLGTSPVKTSPGLEGAARQYSHSSPSRNLFRFKTDGVLGLGTPPESPYSLSPVGGDGPLGTSLASPRRSPRKIARSPFKVGRRALVYTSTPLNHIQCRTGVRCGLYVSCTRAGHVFDSRFALSFTLFYSP